MRKKKFDFLINGLSVEAEYSQHTLDHLWIPLLEKLTSLQWAKGSRLIVFLAAPPAVGKSTLSNLLCYLSENTPGITPIQAVGLDGFHYHQNEIESRTVYRDGRAIPMAKVKGAPESYHLEKLRQKLRQLEHAEQKQVKWPFYDRTLHDVVEESIKITGDILLIEGNWLLSDEDDWKDISGFCDYSIFISADESILRERLIGRKQQGGMSREQAAEFYHNSDRLNILRASERRVPADLELAMTPDGDYVVL